MNHKQQTQVDKRVPGTEAELDWTSLRNKYVGIYRKGQLIREGRVEVASQDAQMIWLESFGTNPRVLFEMAEGYEVHLRPDVFRNGP